MKNYRINFHQNVGISGFLPEVHSYGFNGMEKENEHTSGNYDFGARILDTRLGRWLSVDPLHSSFASKSVYSFIENCPIRLIDGDGKEWVNPYWSAMQTEMNLENPDWEKVERLSEMANTVTCLLEEFKNNDPELYGYIENAKFGENNNYDVHVRVYISDADRSQVDGSLGYTSFGIRKDDNDYIYSGGVFNDDFKGQEDMKGPYENFSIFNVILFNGSSPIDEVLANEAGDVMFALNEPQLSIDEENADLPYSRRFSTNYSFNVEAIYKARKEGQYSKDGDAFPLKIDENSWTCEMPSGDTVNHHEDPAITEKK